MVINPEHANSYDYLSLGNCLARRQLRVQLWANNAHKAALHNEVKFIFIITVNPHVTLHVNKTIVLDTTMNLILRIYKYCKRQHYTFIFNKNMRKDILKFVFHKSDILINIQTQEVRKIGSH